MKDGKKSRQGDRGQRPLVYHGVRFYQASYGPNGKIDKLVISAKLPGSPEKKDV